MSPLLTLLNEIREQPVAMYVGSASLLKFADFLRGFDHAIEKLGHQPDHFLEKFRDWVQAKFNTSTEGWEHLILRHSSNEVEAIKRFWDLLDEYLQETGFQGADSHPIPVAKGSGKRVPA
jgi:hypothetical protein